MLTILFILFLVIMVLFFIIFYYRVYIYSWFIRFPKPIYHFTIDKDVMVTMPDGIKLATDVYRPKKSNKYPVIILRTPYGKRGHMHPYKQMALLFASQGYVFIVQDVRGRYHSEGVYDPFQNEAVDGNVTVDWAGKASWSNGKVALYGFSYLGSCAWLVAPYHNRYLKTIVPMFSTQDTYSIFMTNGIFHLKGALYWLTTFNGKEQTPNLTFGKIKESLMKLPVSKLDIDVMGHPIPAYQNFVSHPIPDDFWAKICVNKRMSEIDIPAFIVSGWFDIHLQGAIDDFTRMVNSPEHSKNRESYLVIGPWAHNPSQTFKGITYGPKAVFTLQLIHTLKWCDYWLKDDKDALKGMSKVKYFMMGKNEWRESQEWPPKNIRTENYYLSQIVKDKKESLFKLSTNPPEEVAKTHYIYNPSDPVPFRGSHHLHDPAWVGPFEQKELLSRKDVITYISEPLEQNLEIAGFVKLVLFVSSSALDTDFCAKICDMLPNGESYNLQAGFVRMRYRESLHMPSLIEPGKVYRLEISLRSVAHAFLKNHRIQLQVTSCDFPVHDRNLNTGENCEFSTELKIADQTIYTGGGYPSHLVLPVLKSS